MHKVVAGLLTRATAADRRASRALEIATPIWEGEGRGSCRAANVLPRTQSRSTGSAPHRAADRSPNGRFQAVACTLAAPRERRPPGCGAWLGRRDAIG